MRNRRWNNYNQYSSDFRLSRDNKVRDDEFDNDEVDSKDMEIRFMQRCVDDILNDDIDEYKLERFNRHLKLFFKNKTFYKVTSAKKLKNLINACTKYLGPDCDLNWIDVSKMKSMQKVFYQTKFNGDISKWDVSHVENMKNMFFDSEFNGDISGWNVGKVTNMFLMFCYSNFNRDISDWDVSSVTNMESMFLYSKFNSDISDWDVSGVMNMWHMFVFSPFDSDISNWEINPDANITATFAQCPIREEFKPKSLLQLSEAASNFNLRKGATVRDDEFDNDEVSVEDILQRGMKYQLKKIIDRILDETALENEIEYFKEKCLEYNGVPFYKVQKKEQLLQLIYTCIDYLGVNCNLNWIDISYLTDLSYLFIETEFNGNISLWDTSNIKNMSYMFLNSKFNGDISDWNVSKVTNMRGMFKHSRFNSDISNWDVSNVQNMAHMFDDSEFRGDISRWNTISLNMFEDMFKGCPINKEFKPRSLLQLSESAFNLQRNNRVSNVEFDDADMNNAALATTRLYKRLKNNKENFDKINEFFSESRLYLDEKGYLISHRDVELKKDCPFIDEDGHLTIQFKSVDGDFSCPEGDNVALCSLEGCPEIVGGSFNCKHVVLDNLNGGPLHVGRYYYCGDADPAEVAAQCEVEKGSDYIITSAKTKELFDLLIKQ